jgi:Protein of unknown function (DUF4058)
MAVEEFAMPIHDWTRVYSGMFHDFHQSWSIYIKNALNSGILPNGVSALVEHKAGPTEPDVLTVDEWVARGKPWSDRDGSATLAKPTTQIIQKSTRERYAERANRIVIQQRLGHTIAVIEIISPGNKDGARAFKKFVEKSQDFIASGIHLLVVDLFPPTKRDPQGIHRAIWDDFEDQGREFEFPTGKDRIAVSYDAGEIEKVAYVEPLAVGDAIPDMPLFLGDGYNVLVPLEATYQTTWSFLPASLQEIVVTGRIPNDDE